MKYTAIIFFLYVCFAATLATYSQEIPTQTIRGTVKDQVTNYPLVGALVGVDGDVSLSAITNSHGVFEIQNVPLGRQSLEVSYIGYKTRRIDNILVVSGKETVLEISLEEEAIEIEAITIRALLPRNRGLNEMAMVSSRAISVEQTERFAGSLGDPARMVANYAGVSSKDDSRNDIIIRGNSPSGVLWRLEGVDVPNPNHFGALGATGGPVSMINNNLLSSSDFMTGAFPAEYGNALAGAFDLYLRPGNNQKREYTGQIGFNGFELGAEGPITTDKTVNPSYLVNFRYSTLEVMQAMGMDFGTGAAIPQYKDLSYHVVIPTENHSIISLFGLWGNSFIQLGRDIDTVESSYNARATGTDFGSGLGVFGASHTHYFNQNVRLKSTISFQQTRVTTEFDSIRPGDITVPIFREEKKQDKVSFHQQLRYKLSANTNVRAGYNYNYFTIDFIDSVYSQTYNSFVTGTDISGNMHLARAYGQIQFKPNNKLTTTAGIHSQYFSISNQFALEPRAGIEYAITEKQSVSVGYGIHNQTQTHEVYFHQFYDSVTDSYLKPNKNLRFTTSTHYVLGYNIFVFDNWRLKTELYYQSLKNVPVSKHFDVYSMINAGADFTTPRIRGLENKGTGTNKGVEITIERFLDKGFYILTTASFFDSKYTDYNSIERNTAFNGNYILNFLGGYEISVSHNNIITFDIRTTYAGGKRYIPVDLEASQEHNEMRYDWDNIFAKKYDPYFRTDARIGFKMNGKRITQEWALDLQNLTNYRSIFMEAYDNEKNDIYYFYQQGFMPMMLYRINF